MHPPAYRSIHVSRPKTASSLATYVIISSRTRLNQTYGQAGFAQIDRALRTLVSTAARRAGRREPEGLRHLRGERRRGGQARRHPAPGRRIGRAGRGRHAHQPAPDGERAALERIKELLQKRVASQPLNQPNAGSVFRNPPGDHAARLIESCGLKGFTVGAAQISRKHANFIVNVGNASARDIESVIDHVHGTVLAKTGVDLVHEVRIVGEAA